MSIDDHLRAYVATLRDLGAIQSPAVEQAFRTVRRDRCVTQVFLSRTERIEVPQDHLPPESVLDLIYGDDALLTRLPGADFTTASSSSLPSLMARMLEALELRPGHRVQEIGAGTGYNAALMATITGAPVVSIDVQDVVVAGAQSAMRRLGLDTVTVRCADGYAGCPAEAPYHRIIVTVACTGISPRWVDQLDRDGLVIAPIAHGGDHPILAVSSQDGTLVGRPVLWTGFMHARGPLYQWPDSNRPQVLEPLTIGEYTTHHGIIPVLSPSEYTDLRFFMAVRDPRVTDAFAPNVNPDLDKGRCALLDPERGTAFVMTDAIALAGEPSLLDDLTRLYDEWERIGRPHLTDWRCELAVAGDPATPILVPREWRPTKAQGVGTVASAGVSARRPQ